MLSSRGLVACATAVGWRTELSRVTTRHRRCSAVQSLAGQIDHVGHHCTCSAKGQVRRTKPNLYLSPVGRQSRPFFPPVGAICVQTGKLSLTVKSMPAPAVMNSTSWTPQVTQCLLKSARPGLGELLSLRATCKAMHTELTGNLPSYLKYALLTPCISTRTYRIWYWRTG